ncbi:PBAN-type neuropeptides-like [Toxorhynchites rutilus septentrionalis]|uniref:PBAN-type neuropeptides-like n=1 Tax=Toxorhynchites rutilus septentrionalis TaxID=329112 RepID=UPI002479FE92|nr:PBAN-type neuropeptides-like [Toxorhynchites rutilus septentrionalis]
MWKLYFFFNVVCLYLAVRSALSAEVMDPNEQKMSNYLSSSGGNRDDEETNKRGAAMWFGPRLGKRTISPELHDEMLDELDPVFYTGEPPQRLAADIAQGSPYVVLLLTGRVPRSPQSTFYHTTTPRLGRRDASPNENHSRPPFAPRLGRTLPFSPRLGRSFTDSYGY